MQHSNFNHQIEVKIRLISNWLGLCGIDLTLVSYYLAIVAYTCAIGIYIYKSHTQYTPSFFGAVAGDLVNIKLIKFCSNLVHSCLLISLAAFVFDLFQVIGTCQEEICG